MKHLIWNLYYRHRKNSGYAIAGAFSCLAVICSFWCISSLVLMPKTRSLENSFKSDSTTLAVQKSGGSHQPATDSKAGVPATSAAIVQFQGELVACAKTTNCTIAQFTPDPTPAAYVSVYNVQAPDFASYHVRTTISGNLGSILTCLQRMADGSIPFEITNMTVSGDPSNKAGSNAATVGLTVMVVSKSPPPPPAPTGGS